MVNDTEPRYRLVDADGNVGGSLFAESDGALKLQEGTSGNDNELTFGTDGALSLTQRFIENIGVSAFLSSNQSISADTDTIVEFDTVVDDDRGEWDTSTHEFTAAQDGDYSIVAQVEWTKGSSGDEARLQIAKNGSRIRRGKRRTAQTTDQVRTVALKVSLSAGDTVKFIFENASSSCTLSGFSDRSYVDIIQVA